jgi:hypothetical protein
MDGDLLRVRALTRDEARLRCAVERHQRNRFDLDAVLQVRRTVDDLLETLGFIARDNLFWNRLRAEGEVLEASEIDALQHFDGDGLGALLVACGYRSPPKPPVEQLISDTRDALGYAAAARSQGDQVDAARRQLQRFIERTRRQVADPANEPPHEILTVGQRAGQVARDVLPVAAGVAAGAIVEAALPGSGAGVQTGMGVAALGRTVVEKGITTTTEKAAENGTRWAVGTLVGRSAKAAKHQSADHSEDGETSSRVPAADEAVLVHLAAAQQHLHASLRGRALGGSLRGGDLLAAMRHVRRVADIAQDNFGPNVLTSSASLALEVLETARRLDHGVPEARIFDGTPLTIAALVDLASSALDLAVKANGTPSANDSTPWGAQLLLGDAHLERATSQRWDEWKAMLRPSLRGLDVAEQAPSAYPNSVRDSACDDEEERRFRHY